MLPHNPSNSHRIVGGIGDSTKGRTFREAVDRAFDTLS